MSKLWNKTKYPCEKPITKMKKTEPNLRDRSEVNFCYKKGPSTLNLTISWASIL